MRIQQEQVTREAGDLTFSVLWDSMSATFSLTNNGTSTIKIIATAVRYAPNYRPANGFSTYCLVSTQ
jgi:hypothetical protein